MALLIDKDLPAFKRLQDYGNVYDINSSRPDLRIAFINLMPNKEDTEYDFMKLMVRHPANVAVIPVKMATHRYGKTTSTDHINRFYSTFDSICNQIDGVIITGAPLENVAFEDVDYWNEITVIFDQLHHRRIPTLNVCWAAYAVIYHRWSIPMLINSKKLSGIYPNEITYSDSLLLKGIRDGFRAPFSRFATWPMDDVANISELRCEALGQKQGFYLLGSTTHPEWFATGHVEYDTMTLDSEYRRDLSRGLAPSIPENYYPDNDPICQPINSWHDTAQKLMSNWIDICLSLNKTNQPQHFKQ